ncbi:MAG: DUF368 domain-containing protein [Lachnospiraceae bacterium]|nr:DUF368 domain-containing protein [Lachnospiraceae bacterium]
MKADNEQTQINTDKDKIGNKKNSLSPVTMLKNFICGAAIGGGAILPGISGGVLCVVFGVYRAIMELFSHPVKAIKKNWKMFLFVGLGWIFGFWIFAKVIEFLFAKSEMMATWLFIGLIIGTVPALYKEAGKHGRSKGSFISMFVAFATLTGILTYVQYGEFVQVTPSFGWYIFSGALWGLSIVVPGMTSSSILMSLGIYQDLNSGIASFDMGVMIPWVIGMFGTAILLARLVTYFFDKLYSLSFHAVLGIVLASTVVIIPLDYNNVLQLIAGILFGGAGFIIAYLSDKMDLKVKSES